MPEPATLNKHSRNMKLNQVTSIAPPHKSIPPANAARDAQSAGFGVLMIPANIPLIPVIFPQRRNLETATAPMARPPLTALIGVKKGEMLLPTPLFSCIRLLFRKCENVRVHWKIGVIAQKREKCFKGSTPDLGCDQTVADTARFVV